MRLIDADAMEKHIMESKVFNQYFKELVQSLIWAENTIEAERVRRGEWWNNEYGFMCSNCHHDCLYDGWNKPVRSIFCPNCGADMREES
jgi:hypothetical protein